MRFGHIPDRLRAYSAKSLGALPQVQARKRWPMRRCHVRVSCLCGQATSILSQPREERLANLERFTSGPRELLRAFTRRCITCKFRRRPSQEDVDLRKLMLGSWRAPCVVLKAKA